MVALTKSAVDTFVERSDAGTTKCVAPPGLFGTPRGCPSEPVKVSLNIATDDVMSKPSMSLCAPPGLSCPPGLEDSEASGLTQRQAELFAETKRLQEENARLANDRLELESARLAQENLMLRAMLQVQPPAMLLPRQGGPPGAWAAPAAAAPAPPGVWATPPGNWAAPSLQTTPKGRGNAAVKDKSPSKSSRTQARRASLSSVLSDGSTADPGSESDGQREGSFSEETDCSGGESVPETTVMMRNIPNSYTRERLLALLDSHDFALRYDLVYLPIDFCSRAGLGYAFLNFKTAQDAKRFREYFHGFDDWGVFSEKACDALGSAAHQGLEANMERYRNSPVMHESVPDEFRPVVFKDGVRVPFPPPTRRLRAPELRRRTMSAEENMMGD